MGDFFNTSQYDVPNDGIGGQSGANQGGQPESVGPQNLVHVTLSQIAKLTRKEEGLVLHRQKVHTIVTIGVVISVEELTTKNIYLIDDYTLGSPVEVQLWKNDMEDNGNVQVPFVPPTVLERTYIQVIGQARYDDRKPFVVAFRVEPISDPNDIHCHFLQAIHDSMFLEKRMNATINSQGEGTGGFGAGVMESEFGQSSRVMSGFTEIQRTVLNVLNKYGQDSPYGLKRYEIRNYMTGVNSNLIDDAINFLVNEGHIFSTTDEDTFKSTNY